MRAREFITESQAIIAYHGTTDDINQFRPLTHFGTEKAAHDRMDYKKNKNGKIYKVQLDIRNPFTIKDFPGIHYDRVYAFELRDKKKISQEEMEAITMLQDPAKLRAALIAKVKELGYDGFVYKNRYEDKGNISYVILDPRQVKVLEVIPVGEETVTESRQPSEYVYHASFVGPNPARWLKSLIQKGLQPSKEGYSGPGTYFAYAPDEGYYHVSPEDSKILRVRWADLVKLYGVYPNNPNGIERDDDEIIVPGPVPGNVLEVEYFEDEWWDLQSALNAETYHYESVDEAEEDTPHAREIATDLSKLGYKKLGSGADATVWAKERGYVIKILMPEDPTSKAAQVFQRFYEFCQEHQDLACLPRFNEVNTIDVQGKDYTQIDMERLIRLQSGSFEEGMVWYFSDYVTKGTPWKQVKAELSSQDDNKWLHTDWHNVARGMADKVADFNTKQEAMWSQLYNVMMVLYKTGQINKLGWDLHTENVMRRRSGQLVIIDPWFAIEEQD